MANVDPYWWFFGLAILVAMFWLGIELFSLRRRRQWQADRTPLIEELQQHASDVPNLNLQTNLTVANVTLHLALPTERLGVWIQLTPNDPDTPTPAAERRLLARGWHIVRFTASEIRRDPAGCLQELNRLRTPADSFTQPDADPTNDPYAV